MRVPLAGYWPERLAEAPGDRRAKRATGLTSALAWGLLFAGRIMRKTLAALSLSCSVLAAAGCANEAVDDQDNPFLQDQSDDGKADSAYMNPDGIEVEVDLEGDVEGPAYRLQDAPVDIGQYAMTYFRKSETMYIESLAEDGTASNRAEWLVDGTWYTADRVPAGATLKHWRLRGLDTVLLFDYARDADVGTTFTAKVPVKPFSVFSDAGKKCADDDDHIGLDQSVYWYRWEPDQSSCTIPLQDLKVTVSKKFPKEQATLYPEYDQLVADQKVTMVVLFGQIDDGELTEYETGMRNFKRFGTWLVQAGFAKAASAPLGQRYSKKLGNGVTIEIDLYSPREFSGLGDFGHFDNFQKALSEHEVVAYDGHSMLGASDFWARPQYPGFYQVFLYGGCLGYEYYVKPILHGKGDSWDKLDIVSSVVEVTASANEFAAPAMAKLIYGIQHDGRSSWRNIMLAVRNSVGDSTFGVSGVRDNCFSPSGSRCQ